MAEKYILVSDDEYCYTLDTSDENYKTLEDFEKQEFKNAKHDGIDIKDYEDAILESANDNYWDWVYTNHLEADTVNDILNTLVDENEQLKKDLNEYCNFSLHTILDKKNKEIEKLKSICQDHRDHAIDFKADCVRLEKENEELKENCKNYNWYKQCKTLLNENDELKVELNKLEEDLDYYKTKCASLETGLLQAQRDVEWLRDNTVWEQMPSSKRTVTKTFK